jgi:hypothetical protein
MSASKTPLVHEVIPLFDVVTRALTDYIGDTTLQPVIRVAAARGRVMMNKYYGLTDDSIVYRIAMCKSLSTTSPGLLTDALHDASRRRWPVLHPRYKTSYFHLVGWPREWITTAEELFRSEWTTNYKPKRPHTQTTPPGVMYISVPT